MHARKYSFERPLMHTIIRISVISDKGTVFTNDRLEIAFQQFADVTEKFTRFKPTSELSKLNNATKGQPFKVSPELFGLIKYSLEVATKTDGLFDPTIIDLLEAYGYGASADFAKLDNPNLIKEIHELLLTRKTYRLIKLDEVNSTVTLAPNQRLDLGGIGKGYAIDLAHDILLKDFDFFIINAGGDIRAHGRKLDGSPWLVALEKAPQFITNSTETNWRTIELNDMALAASGAWSRRIRFFHHLINPKTGLPVEDTAQVFTIAKTAMEADAWATALFMMGKDGIEVAKENGVDAWIINHKGQINKS
jgi:thiamine biosynthesis lipoprotein